MARGLTLAAAVAVALTAAVVSASDVLNLGTDSFDAAIAENSRLLVAFVAPWCGHCKKLKPEYEAAATMLAPEGIKLAMVDATAHADLVSRFEIRGYPTIKFFRDGMPQEYNGGRDRAAIAAWMRKRSGPATRPVASVADLEKLKSEADVVNVAFVKAADSALAQTFEKVASASEEGVFAMIAGDSEDERAVRAQFNVADGEEAVFSINNFAGEENVNRVPAEELADASAETLGDWLATRSLPAVVTFSPETAQKIFGRRVPSHYLLFADEEHTAVVADFTASAKANAGEVLFVRIPSKEERVLSFFGLTPASFPTAMLISMDEAGMKKYKWTGGEFETAAFTTFLQEFKAGNLKPWLKSEPAPDAAENEAAPVKVVTGENFESLVVNNDKDVLLEVYAPWCGHCKQLEPIYKALGEAVQSAAINNVVIAKMDGTANEVDYPGLKVSGYPTLFFFPAGSKSAPVEYSASRDAAGFVSFLRKHATNGFNLEPEDVVVPTA